MGSPTDAAISAPFTATDRAIDRIADVVAGWLYRSIEVDGAQRIPQGAILALLNHGGGFGDPVVLIAGIDRMPRFIARDVIWKVPLARNIMDAVQAIPIHRRADSPTGEVDNTDAFAEVTEALRGGQFVAIFPEGDSIDVPRVDHVRTGAARMVLQAHRSGVAPLHVVPIGLHYQNKSNLRSEVHLEVGAPLDMAQEVAAMEHIEDDHEKVRELTRRFAAALRAVSPDFQDWGQAFDLQGAAGIALRTVDDAAATEGPGDLVATYGHETQLAGLLADAPAEQLDAVRKAYREYSDDLKVFGVTDADVAGRTRLRGQVLRRVVETAVAAPVALAVLPANAPGILLTALAGRLPLAPPTMATVKPMTAMLAFPAGWIWYAARGRPGLARGAGRLLAAQAGLAASLIVADRGGAVWRAGTAWAASRHQPADGVLQHRQAVVTAVRDAATAAVAARSGPAAD